MNLCNSKYHGEYSPWIVQYMHINFSTLAGQQEECEKVVEWSYLGMHRVIHHVYLHLNMCKGHVDAPCVFYMLLLYWVNRSYLILIAKCWGKGIADMIRSLYSHIHLCYMYLDGSGVKRKVHGCKNVWFTLHSCCEKCTNIIMWGICKLNEESIY